jgi:hypothetical protein
MALAVLGYLPHLPLSSTSHAITSLLRALYRVLKLSGYLSELDPPCAVPLKDWHNCPTTRRSLEAYVSQDPHLCPLFPNPESLCLRARGYQDLCRAFLAGDLPPTRYLPCGLTGGCHTCGNPPSRGRNTVSLECAGFTPPKFRKSYAPPPQVKTCLGHGVHLPPSLLSQKELPNP